MELDDLKNTWKETNGQGQDNESVNLQILEKMNNKYQSTLKQIAVPEMGGGIICLAAAVFIVFSFEKLDTAFLEGAGALAVLLLLVLPIISFQSLRYLSRSGNVNKPYAETLRDFASQKIRFIKLQKVNVTLCYLLMVMMIVLLSRIFGNKDISDNRYYWIFSFTIGYIFLLFYSRWVEKKYGKTLQHAEELLNEYREITA